MRWPWRKQKVETRGAGGYTALSMAARADAITGRGGAAETVAAVQACVALWSNALSRADVEGDNGLLTPHVLAVAGRALATRGEAVFALDGDRLAAAGGWEINTSGGAPRAYRLTIYDAGGSATRTALAAEVLHFRINASDREPWRGRSPLGLAPVTADLLSVVEAAVSETLASAPLGSAVLPVPEMNPEDRERLAASFRGQRGRTLLRESVNVAAAGGPAPQTDWKTQDLTPDLQKSGVFDAWDRARDSITQVFGVDPSLLSSVASGPGLREAQRHFVTYHMQPVAGLIAAECSEKLGQPVTLDLVRPLGAVDHGGRARAAAALVGAVAAARAGGVSETELAALMRFVDLQGLTEQ